jgi:hypothetical protein
MGQVGKMEMEYSIVDYTKQAGEEKEYGIEIENS